MGDLRTAADAVILAAFPGVVLPGWMRRRLEAGVGGVCLFGGNVSRESAALRSLTDAIRAANPDCVVATDEEGGDVTRLHAATGSPYPGNAALGAVDDLDVTRRVMTSIGAELAVAGIDLDLGPCLDVNSDPLNPVIGVRSFGADAGLVARHGVAAIAGLRAAGVAACVKHFPGHGDTRQDSHVDLPVVTADEEVLRRRELVPFRAAIDAGVPAVMTSHVVLPALDHAPATFSRRILSDLLRIELGFDGVVVTDALDMAGATRWAGSVPKAAVASLAAGADLLCVGSDHTVDDALLDAVSATIVTAVRTGALDEARLRDAVERVGRLSPSARAVRRDADVDLEVGSLAARRALVVDGELPPTRGAVVVVLHTASGNAVGDVPWSPGAAWVAADPSATVVDVLPGDEVELESVAADGRPVVLVTRGSGQQWVDAAVARLADRRPDLVVVDMGWPPARHPAAAARVRTHGASRASGAAVAALLAAR